MSRKKSEINEISKRIIRLSGLYPSAKSFIAQCNISNHSLITDLKKKRIKNPGGDILAKIVKGTGCNGSWLLTGKGEMFVRNAESQENSEISYLVFNGPDNLVDEFEKAINGIIKNGLCDDLEIKLGKLLVSVLEHRQKTLN